MRDGRRQCSGLKAARDVNEKGGRHDRPAHGTPGLGQAGRYPLRSPDASGTTERLVDFSIKGRPGAAIPGSDRAERSPRRNHRTALATVWSSTPSARGRGKLRSSSAPALLQLRSAGHGELSARFRNSTSAGGAARVCAIFASVARRPNQLS